MDGFCLPETAPTFQSVRRKCRTGIIVVFVALASYQFSRHGRSSRRLLVSFFSCVYGSDDGNESLDRSDL